MSERLNRTIEAVILTVGLLLTSCFYYELCQAFLGSFPTF